MGPGWVAAVSTTIGLVLVQRSAPHAPVEHVSTTTV
jgi:hypothetical protein